MNKTQLLLPFLCSLTNFFCVSDQNQHCMWEKSTTSGFIHTPNGSMACHRRGPHICGPHFEGRGLLYIKKICTRLPKTNMLSRTERNSRCKHSIGANHQAFHIICSHLIHILRYIDQCMFKVLGGHSNAPCCLAPHQLWPPSPVSSHLSPLYPATSSAEDICFYFFLQEAGLLTSCRRPCGFPVATRTEHWTAHSAKSRDGDSVYSLKSVDSVVLASSTRTAQSPERLRRAVSL